MLVKDLKTIIDKIYLEHPDKEVLVLDNHTGIRLDIRDIDTTNGWVEDGQDTILIVPEE